MSNNPLNVLPSAMTLKLLGNRLETAKLGHSLLKKKSDALTIKFRSILKDIKQEKEGMTDLFRRSFFSLAEARYSAGDLSVAVMESLKCAAIRVNKHTMNIAGVKMPKFTLEDTTTTNSSSMTCPPNKSLMLVSRGSEQVLQCKSTFGEAVQRMIKLASLQSSFVSLDKAIKSTNRRVNALDKIIEPKLEKSIQYVTDELKQIDIEELYRIKKVRDNKIKAVKKKNDLKLALNKEINRSTNFAPPSDDHSIYQHEDSDIVV